MNGLSVGGEVAFLNNISISKVKISRHEDGVFIAKSALLPGCHAHGRDRGEAILRFQQAAKDEGRMMNQKLRSAIQFAKAHFPVGAVQHLFRTISEEKTAIRT